LILREPARVCRCCYGKRAVAVLLAAEPARKRWLKEVLIFGQSAQVLAD
jgi:hypothetical protein